MAKAILELADTIHSINSRIVILSPFSQHFPSHPQGLYENFTSVKNLNETICQPHKIPYSENNKHIDTINFINAMNKIDKNWEQKIGFYEGFTSMSSSWHDLHPESRSTGFSVDCTHYIFQPLMFEEIWLSLSNYLKKDHHWIRSLAKPRRKINKIF